MIDFFEDVTDFHLKFQLKYVGKPRKLPDDLSDFRIKFMAEELEEYTAATQALDIAVMEGDEAEITHQLEKAMDALIDLCYVALGTAQLHGFPFREGWARVQAANMLKERALREQDSKRGSTWDVIKPPGWEPPQHTDLVEDHEHRR